MDELPNFPNDFDEVLLVAGVAGNQARFGLDVLAGLVEGIGDFIEARQDRWRPDLRSLGPALIASAMWIDDDELIDAIGHLVAASVIVTKQGRRPTDLRKLEPLVELNHRPPGMPIRAFSDLSGLASTVGGQSALSAPLIAPTRRSSRRFGPSAGGRPGATTWFRSSMPSSPYSGTCGGMTKMRSGTWTT